jgi:hypothetical protein
VRVLVDSDEQRVRVALECVGDDLANASGMISPTSRDIARSAASRSEVRLLAAPFGRPLGRPVRLPIFPNFREY